MPININKFIDELRAGLYRARNNSPHGWTTIVAKSGLGMRLIRGWETGDTRGTKKNMPNITSLAQLLHVYATHTGKVEKDTDRLVRNFNKCDPQIRRFISLMANVFANRTK